MNEQLRIRLTSNGQPLAVVAADGGIVLRGESSAAPRRVVLEFRGFGAPTLTRIGHVQEREGWRSNTFPLHVRVTDDGFTIAGIRSNTLPAGIYDCRLSIDDVRFPKSGRFRVEIDENATAEIELDATEDPRQIALTRAIGEFPRGLQRLLTATQSMLDGMPAVEWLNSLTPRASRKACLLNVLAKLAAERTPLLDTVDTIYDVVVPSVDVRVLGV